MFQIDKSVKADKKDILYGSLVVVLLGVIVVLGSTVSYLESPSGKFTAKEDLKTGTGLDNSFFNGSMCAGPFCFPFGLRNECSGNLFPPNNTCIGGSSSVVLNSAPADKHIACVMGQGTMVPGAGRNTAVLGETCSCSEEETIQNAVKFASWAAYSDEIIAKGPVNKGENIALKGTKIGTTDLPGMNNSGICVGSICIDILPSIFPSQCDASGPIEGGNSDCSGGGGSNMTATSHVACVMGVGAEVVGPGEDTAVLGESCSCSEDEMLENAVLFAAWTLQADSVTVEGTNIEGTNIEGTKTVVNSK